MATPLRDRGSVGQGGDGFTLGEVLDFEESEWPKGGNSARFWFADPRVPDEWRGDGPYDPRAVLEMEAAEEHAWAAERAEWEAQRLRWLGQAAGEECGEN